MSGASIALLQYKDKNQAVKEEKKMKKFLAILLVAVTILPLSLFAPVSVSAVSGYTHEYFFEEASIELINKYNAEIESLIEEIRNSPTEVEVTGTKYYVSSSTGDDKNDGLTPETAWKTLNKINSCAEKFKQEGNVGVFLKRGDTWRIASPLRASGITLSAYGSGAKPKLICSLDASGAEKWEATEWENIYRFKQNVGGLSTNIGAIIFDGGRAWGIHVSPLPKGNKSIITRIDNGTVFNGLEEYTIPYGPFEGAEDLKGNLEFYHDLETGELFLYSKDGNPGEVFTSIELADAGHGITAGSDTLIDNIEIFGTGAHGVSAGTIKNLTVQNCVFTWIGGSIQGIDETKGAVRYGNAVESFGSSDNFIIRHNYATQVYDCCWTAQSTGKATFNNFQVYDNVAEYANTGTEVWVADGGYVTNMKVYDNYDRYIGYGWSHQRPSNNSRTNKNGSGWIGAGGFFYGAGNINMICENNDIMNNVYMFAGSSSHTFAATSPNKFNPHDNVYIMEEGKWIGGTHRPTPVAGEYNEENIERIAKSGHEKNTKFYITKPMPLGYMYALCIPTNGVNIFEDIDDNFWGRDAIDFAVLKGLFNGTTPTEFTPNGKMTRAMLVTVLSRLAGGSGKDTCSFTDVNTNAWYANGVAWAEKNAIVAKGTKFRPDENATREELADMLYRYAQMLYKGSSLEGAPEFADSKSVTPAYLDGVKFCTINGIISGYSDNTIRPKNSATRTEVATMIKRFVTYLGRARAVVDSSAVLSVNGETLKKMLDTSLVRAIVEEDNGVKIIPFMIPGTTSSRTLGILHAYNTDLDLFENPYVVIKFDTNIDKDSIIFSLTGKSAQGWEENKGINAIGKKSDGYVLIDLSTYMGSIDKSTYRYDICIRIGAWDTKDNTAYNPDDYFTTKDLAMFNNSDAAYSYIG